MLQIITISTKVVITITPIRHDYVDFTAQIHTGDTMTRIIRTCIGIITIRVRGV